MSKKSIRNYGLGETKVSGTPRVTQTLEKGTGVWCPNCGCETLFEIVVDVESVGPLEMAGTGKYIGCPACPWASPCVTTIKRQSNGKEEKEKQE